MDLDEETHSKYLSLVEEVQSPASTNMLDLLGAVETSVRWSACSKYFAKVVLQADKHQLVQMAEETSGSIHDSAKTVITKLEASNKVMNNQTLPAQHLQKAQKNIKGSIAILELARREAERTEGGKVWLELSRAKQRQHEEQQHQHQHQHQQQQQQPPARQQQQPPEHQPVKLGNGPGGQVNSAHPFSARNNHLAAAPKIQPAPVKSNQGLVKGPLPLRSAAGAFPAPLPRYHSISAPNLLPPSKLGQQQQQQQQQEQRQQQHQKESQRLFHLQLQRKQQQQQQQLQQQQQQQQQLQQQQWQQHEQRQKPIRGRAAQAKAPPEPEVIHISSDDEGDDGQAGTVGPEAPRHTRHSMRISSTYMEEHDIWNDMSFMYHPDEPKRALLVKGSELKHLRDEEFLNDTIMDFYIRYLQHQLPPERRARCYFFNTFFYTKLSEKTQKAAQGGQPLPKDRAGHARVMKWVKNVNVFDFTYLLMPIHEGSHWSLIIVCHPSHVVQPDEEGQACILHLDSMDGGHASGPVFKHVRDFLRYEWERLALAEAEARGDGLGPHLALPTFQPGPPSAPHFPQVRLPYIPRQDNHCDCGLFVLAYMDFFCHDAPDIMPKDYVADLKSQKNAKALQNGTKAIPSRNPEFLTTRWFSTLNAGGLRLHLRFLFHHYLLEQAEDQTTQECDLLRRRIVEYKSKADNKMLGQCYLPPPEYHAFMHAQHVAEQDQQQKLDALDLQEGDQQQMCTRGTQEEGQQQQRTDILDMPEEQQHEQQHQQHQQHQQLDMQEERQRQQQQQHQQDESQDMQLERQHGVQLEQEPHGPEEASELEQKALEVEEDHESEIDATERKRQQREAMQRRRNRQSHSQQQLQHPLKQERQGQQGQQQLQEQEPLESEPSEVPDEDQQLRELHTLRPGLQDLEQQQQHHHHHQQQQQQQYQQQQKRRCKRKQHYKDQHQEGHHSPHSCQEHSSPCLHQQLASHQHAFQTQQHPQQQQQQQVQCKQPPQEELLSEELLSDSSTGQGSPVDEESEDLQPHTYAKHPGVLRDQAEGAQLLPPGTRAAGPGGPGSLGQQSVCDMTVDDEGEHDEVEEVGGEDRTEEREDDQGAVQLVPGQFIGRQQQQQQQEQEQGNALNGSGLQDGRQEHGEALIVDGAMKSDEEQSGGWQADGNAWQDQKPSKKGQKKRSREQKRRAEQQEQLLRGGSSSKQQRST